MKKPLTASAATLTVALVIPAGVNARPAQPDRRCPQLFTVRMGKRAARRIYRPGHHPTLRNLRLLGYLERCQRNPLAQPFLRSFDHWRARQQQQATTSTAGGGLADVPGVPASFAACVAFRESTDGKLSPNIYGLQSYFPGESLAQQKRVMASMYASRGTQPWAPYDGC